MTLYKFLFAGADQRHIVDFNSMLLPSGYVSPRGESIVLRKANAVVAQ